MPSGYWICPNIGPGEGLMTHPQLSQSDRPKIEDLKFGRRQYRCNWSAAFESVNGWWLIYVDAEQTQWDYLLADSECIHVGGKDLFETPMSEALTAQQLNRVDSWMTAQGFDTTATHSEGVLSDRTVGSVLEEIHASIPASRGTVRNMWVSS
jgi:hypothetical protein